MVSYQYSYLIGDLTLLVIWFILFFSRKDIRKEILTISFIFGIVGLFVQPIYITDWWHPLTLTNTLIGIEDFLFGFGIGGIASVIYSIVFNKRVKIKKVKKLKEQKRNLNYIFIGSLVAGLFFGSFYFLKLTSFYSSIIAFSIPLLIIWLKRRDLIVSSLVSGVLLVFVAWLGFLIPEIITPGWVQSAWRLENLTGIIILNGPLEDIIWAFLTGAFIGPLYEYWKEGKLINIKK